MEGRWTAWSFIRTLDRLTRAGSARGCRRFSSSAATCPEDIANRSSLDRAYDADEMFTEAIKRFASISHATPGKKRPPAPSVRRGQDQADRKKAQLPGSGTGLLEFGAAANRNHAPSQPCHSSAVEQAQEVFDAQDIIGTALGSSHSALQLLFTPNPRPQSRGTVPSRPAPSGATTDTAPNSVVTNQVGTTHHGRQTRTGCRHRLNTRAAGTGDSPPRIASSVRLVRGFFLAERGTAAHIRHLSEMSDVSTCGYTRFERLRR